MKKLHAEAFRKCCHLDMAVKMRYSLVTLKRHTMYSFVYASQACIISRTQA